MHFSSDSTIVLASTIAQDHVSLAVKHFEVSSITTTMNYGSLPVQICQNTNAVGWSITTPVPLDPIGSCARIVDAEDLHQWCCKTQPCLPSRLTARCPTAMVLSQTSIFACRHENFLNASVLIKMQFSLSSSTLYSEYGWAVLEAVFSWHRTLLLPSLAASSLMIYHFSAPLSHLCTFSCQQFRS